MIAFCGESVFVDFPPNKTKPVTISDRPMKTHLLTISFLLALPLLAQNPGQVPVPNQQRVRQPINPQPQQNQPLQSEVVKELEENITIRLQGTVTSGSEIDLSLSGVGPQFTADQVINDDTVLTCQYLVSETESGYKVAYTVGTRIKVVTQTNQNSTNYEYRNVSISGNVLCSAGRPVVLVRNGSKPLQLTITRQTEAAGEPSTVAPDSKPAGDQNAKPGTEDRPR